MGKSLIPPILGALPVSTVKSTLSITEIISTINVFKLLFFPTP